MPVCCQRSPRKMWQRGLREWEARTSKGVMFRSLMKYLHRMETILYFIRASWDADLHLHLEAGEALGKLFFAMHRIKYKRLWLGYIADMHALKTGYRSQRHGENWKKAIFLWPRVAYPLCLSVLIMHVSISTNSRKSTVASLGSRTTPVQDKDSSWLHQNCLPWQRSSRTSSMMPEAKNWNITTCLQARSSRSMESSPKSRMLYWIMAIHLLLRETEFNLITHANIPDENVSQILNMDDTSQMLYEEHVSDCIEGDISLWSPMKKLNNKMYMSGNKKQTVNV